MSTRYTTAMLDYMAKHNNSLDGYVMPAKRRNLESEMQRALVKWWGANCQHFGVAECLLFSIPNGGGGGEKRGHWLKMEGCRKGAPDLVLATNSYDMSLSALFMELKTPTGRVLPEQAAFHAALRSQGYRVEIVRTLEEGINIITTYLTK